MARQKDTFYFDGFRRSADYACQAAKLLSEVMHDFNPGQLRERMDSMHAIEKSADEVRHDMMDELVTAFITPFDREDIDELGHVLDDVTDSIEGVLNRMYYDNVTDMRDDAVQMSDMVVRATEIAMSPVPGAKSSKRTSGSPHHTSDRNCSKERCSRGPRHRIARSAPANMPMEISFTPHAVTGMSMPFRLVGCVCTPNRRGSEKP